MNILYWYHGNEFYFDISVYCHVHRMNSSCIVDNSTNAHALLLYKSDNSSLANVRLYVIPIIQIKKTKSRKQGWLTNIFKDSQAFPVTFHTKFISLYVHASSYSVINNTV